MGKQCRKREGMGKDKIEGVQVRTINKDHPIRDITRAQGKIIKCR